MPCYNPLTAVIIGKNAETGKNVLKFLKGVKFDNSKHKDESIIPIPCNQCIGCRLEKSRQWAIRCVFEASLYSDNSFITLTFNNQHLNVNQTLVKSDFQKFMKRLRKHTDNYYYDKKQRQYIKREIPLSKQGITKKIRYFHCGEYGEKLQRPHHHACLFNYDFEDKKLWSTRKGVRLYRSPLLEKLWSDPITKESYGYCTVGEVTFESAAYVARYVTKKITGGKAHEHYKGRQSEYTTMSRRPGIAKDWFSKYKDTDVYNRDMVVVREGIKCKPPKYFDKLFDEIDPIRYTQLKESRVEKAKNNPDNELGRLSVREKVKLSKTKHLRRNYETQNI